MEYATPPPIVVHSSSNAAHVDSTCRQLDLSVDDFHELRRQSASAAENAYCPYSQFPVGAAVLTRERVALGRAVFEGHRDFKALAVLAAAAPSNMPSSPCGMCRQFIREFCELDMPVLMFTKDGHYVAVKLGVLLPLSFGPDALGPRP
ncbi:cytidine deaminase [Niveomyces insectorum RCEF 264]|uniref:Cytidine deaminase n=1 Tax=Niveomyces insectorum RCEF 264 TaxID=1081102 RepID=A0A167X348_9HYPO|nr:cytidine deaminase [Niveomyces insectorum RCEF 264]